MKVSDVRSNRILRINHIHDPALDRLATIVRGAYTALRSGAAMQRPVRDLAGFVGKL